jgi:hypothetical protein
MALNSASPHPLSGNTVFTIAPEQAATVAYERSSGEEI